MYRPLPDCLTIAPSEIEGLGLFATAKIKKNTVLGITHYHSVWNGLIRTPLGGFYNHSETPNIIIEDEDIDTLSTLMISRMKTLRDIEVGEELLATYRLYQVS